MKKYTVYHNNNIEVNIVAEFGTIEEAKNFCAEETKGGVLVQPEDNNWENKSNNYHYEVYDGEPAETDEEGVVVELKEPVYQTEQYYE